MDLLFYEKINLSNQHPIIVRNVKRGEIQFTDCKLCRVPLGLALRELPPINMRKVKKFRSAERGKK